MTPDQFIKAQLSAFAFREAAHHGGIDNMLAVAFVIRNRKNAGWSGGDWMEIISAAPQHSGTIVPLVGGAVPNLRDINFRIFLSKVDDLFSGFMPDSMTQGAKFYAELHNITNPWFKDKILSDPDHHPRVATIGQVAFFA